MIEVGVSVEPERCTRETITDIRTESHIPEVELISLLEEQLPQYKLRADTLTDFAGYKEADWFIPPPITRVNKQGVIFTDEQIRQILNYFVLSGERISQMTKTYDDIEAVTKLLEEKEKDLELAALIGQSLLCKNKTLEEKLTSLDCELSAANEAVTQLKHDLTLKTELLQLYTHDIEDSGSDGGTPLGLRSLTLDLLQRKISGLEADNKKLRVEASQLANETDDTEEKEQQLLQDIFNQLSEANSQVKLLTDEINTKYEENAKQQDEISALVAQVSEFKTRSKNLSAENEELIMQLTVARECQNELATELADLKERYAEVLDLLRELQEHLKRQGKKSLPTVRLGGVGMPSLNPSPLPPTLCGPDSLAAELAFSSLDSESSVDSGISARSRKGPHLQRLFDTVRCVNRAQEASLRSPFNSGLSSSVLSSPRLATGFPSLNNQLVTPEIKLEDVDANDPVDENTSIIEDYPSTSRPGIPGTPGSFDLTVALRRLDQITTTPSAFTPPRSLSLTTVIDTNCRWRTPDTIMSTGCSSSILSDSSWGVPEKLKPFQIVKPMEGSVTLGHWSRLAQPHIGSILEEQEGVTTKCSNPVLDSIFTYDEYTLSDIEEDEVLHPGKSFESSGPIYTFINSVVKHPDGDTLTTPCLGDAQMSVGEAPIEDRSSIRQGSCKTFSTNVGIARALHEWGLGSHMSDSSSPAETVTPCNSRDHSPSQSPTRDLSAPGGFTDFLNQSAALFKRTLTGQSPDEKPRGRLTKRRSYNRASPSDMKALTQINLMGKLEELGLEKVIPRRGVSPAVLRQALEASLVATHILDRSESDLKNEGSNNSHVRLKKGGCKSSRYYINVT
ncbi:trafficking kinesin-binding protein milt-like isoform X3 [Artemia franciscana]|uniref:trafficking kinesin-binding protein milt-like isoform X3 n=1 Tax=Artemia franciscana TaxID=6661 RepID=UPI0032DABFB8